MSTRDLARLIIGASGLLAVGLIIAQAMGWIHLEQPVLILRIVSP